MIATKFKEFLTNRKMAKFVMYFAMFKE